MTDAAPTLDADAMRELLNKHSTSEALEKNRDALIAQGVPAKVIEEDIKMSRHFESQRANGARFGAAAPI